MGYTFTTKFMKAAVGNILEITFGNKPSVFLTAVRETKGKKAWRFTEKLLLELKTKKKQKTVNTTTVCSPKASELTDDEMNGEKVRIQESKDLFNFSARLHLRSMSSSLRSGCSWKANLSNHISAKIQWNHQGADRKNSKNVGPQAEYKSIWNDDSITLLGIEGWWQWLDFGTLIVPLILVVLRLLQDDKSHTRRRVCTFYRFHISSVDGPAEMGRDVRTSGEGGQQWDSRVTILQGTRRALSGSCRITLPGAANQRNNDCCSVDIRSSDPSSLRVSASLLCVKKKKKVWPFVSGVRRQRLDDAALMLMTGQPVPQSWIQDALGHRV